MRLPRTLRLDQSDLHVFEHACAPGEWAIPGGFVFADVDAARLEGKAQLAFRSGWLGLDSFGHATFVEVAEIAEPDFFQLVERLARPLETDYGAPHFGQALAAARHELADAAALCAHKLGTLLALERQPAAEGFVERFRVLDPAPAGQHVQICQQAEGRAKNWEDRRDGKRGVS